MRRLENLLSPVTRQGYSSFAEGPQQDEEFAVRVSGSNGRETERSSLGALSLPAASGLQWIAGPRAFAYCTC